MSVSEAYEHGKKAYQDGADINHIPGHYSSIEEENFQQGFLDEANKIAAQEYLMSDDIYELEDPSLYDDVGDDY
jgi:hypothetical protein